jgi:beta-lactam-binding protein with PASTA domain
MLKYITHRPLWVNLVTAIVLAVALFAVFILSLNFLTHHGRSRTVPLVVGKPFDEAERILDKEGFDIVIQDSLYVDTLPPLAVIKQVPESDAVVKVNRTVYLTLNRARPPMIDMPNLIGYSFRNAEMNLSNAGLRVGDTIYKSDFAKNSVLDQLYNGQHITPGTKIQMGSAVTLVLGSGVGEMVYAVPNLMGITYGEAKARVEPNGINLLILYAPGVTDTLNAYIVDQQPKRYDEEGKVLKIRTGQFINIKLSTEKPAIDDSTTNNQLPQ